MIWNELDSRLITTGLDVKSKDGIMEAMGGRFVELGYCRPSYIQALKDRANGYPSSHESKTGLGKNELAKSSWTVADPS